MKVQARTGNPVFDQHLLRTVQVRSLCFLDDLGGSSLNVEPSTQLYFNIGVPHRDLDLDLPALQVQPFPDQPHESEDARGSEQAGEHDLPNTESSWLRRTALKPQLTAELAVTLDPFGQWQPLVGSRCRFERQTYRLCSRHGAARYPQTRHRRRGCRVQSVIALMGTSEYRATGAADAGLPELPQVQVNLARMKEVLAATVAVDSPLDVRVLLNPSTSDAMATFVAGVARDADDLLLLYYSGHGLITSEGGLALAHTMTTPELVDFQSLDYQRVRRALANSPARLKIIILDCCYSGTAIHTLLGAADMRGEVVVQGTFVLTSSPATRPSHVIPEEETTAFTGRFLQLIEQSRPDADAISLNTVVGRLRNTMALANLPEPQVVDGNQIGDRPLFRCLAEGELPASTPIPPPRHPPADSMSFTPNRRSRLIRMLLRLVAWILPFFVVSPILSAISNAVSPGAGIAGAGLGVAIGIALLVYIPISLVGLFVTLIRDARALVRPVHLKIGQKGIQVTAGQRRSMIPWWQLNSVRVMRSRWTTVLVAYQAGPNTFPPFVSASGLPGYEPRLAAVVVCDLHMFGVARRDIEQCVARYAGKLWEGKHG